MRSANPSAAGERFRRCVQSVARRGGVDDPRAVCAAAIFKKFPNVRVLKSGRRRGNPDDEQGAAAMFEKFHGRPSDSYTEYQETVKYHSWLAELGRLLSITVAVNGTSGVEVGFRGVKTATDKTGGQIYFMGGDQSVDLARFDLEDSSKQFVKLGPALQIEYHTTKDFHNFEPIDYWHEFGEETGELPDFAYDRLNRAIFIVGGAYQVKREGIVN